MPSPSLLRSDLGALVDVAHRDLTAAWRFETPAAAEETLRDVLPALIEAYGAAAAVVAADWYDDSRDEADVSGLYAAEPVDLRRVGAQELVGWALVSASDVGSLRTLIEGGSQRRIANAARSTIMGSALRDPRADGWQRVSRGGCSEGFCDMLAGRGAVYSEASAGFAAHDHCQCVAVPAFSGQPRPVRPFTPSLRGVSKSDRARVREYLRTH